MSYDMGLEEFRRLEGIRRASWVTRLDEIGLFNEIRDAYRQDYEGNDDDPEPFSEYAKRRITEIAGYASDVEGREEAADVEDREEGHAVRLHLQRGHYPIGD